MGTVTYGYDAAGRRSYTVWPGGTFFVNYDWDVAGDLVGVRENGSTALAVYGYDDLGRRTFLGRGNGVGTGYAYDAVSRLSILAQDPAGTAQDLYVTYGYNPAGQIVTRTGSNGLYDYVPASGTKTYVNDGLNRVTTSGGTAIGYDVNQNLTTGLTLDHGFNARNQMVSAEGGATFAYDPVGRLYQTTGSATYRLLYDGQQAIGEYDGSGTLLRRFVPGAGIDDLILAYEGFGVTDRRWMLDDERGSVIAYAGGSGAVISLSTYSEYGVPGASNAGRFQYTGQMWLAPAGVYHDRARAYSPTMGRFLQTDPMGYAAGANLYAYVGGDPVNATDPLGLDNRPGVTWTCFPGMSCDETTDLGTLNVGPGFLSGNAASLFGRGRGGLQADGGGSGPVRRSNAIVPTTAPGCPLLGREQTYRGAEVLDDLSTNTGRAATVTGGAGLAFAASGGGVSPIQDGIGGALIGVSMVNRITSVISGFVSEGLRAYSTGDYVPLAADVLGTILEQASGMHGIIGLIGGAGR